MKNRFPFSVLLVLLCGCTLFSDKTGESKKPVTDDSLSYYPPTPGKLNQDQFRIYYRHISWIIDTILQTRNFNGGILVAKDGNILYEKYKGLRDLRGTDSINAETPFHIASTSKTFTGIATLRLVQQGKLNLDDSLQTFFPGFPYPSVTVKMLLNHRSGLPNYVYFISSSSLAKKRMIYNQDVLDVLMNEKPNADFKPGTRFSYSNTNFVLLAMIIEKLTGIPFPDYMQQTIFTPLQMKNTFIFTWNDSARVTMSFTPGGRLWVYDNLEGTYGDKNVFSTPRDLLKWDQALYTDQLISKALLDSAFTPYSHEHPSIHNYGLGWRMMNLPTGKNIIYHNGRWHGFNSAFARLTDEKAVIIVLGNRQSSLPYQAVIKCYNIFGPYFPNEPIPEEELDNQDTAKKTQAIKELNKLINSKKKKK